MIYPPDTPPSWEWIEGSNRFWYEERPHMIFHYWKEGGSNPGGVSAFVNMDFNPTTEDIKAFMERALIAAEIQARVVNLRLNNWSGNTNAFWFADLEVIP